MGNIVSFERGMVVAPQPEAAEAGVEVMRAGGNAVDAAIAAAFVQTVVDPLMCGIAGFGTPGYVGAPREGRGARRLRLPARGPRERPRVSIRLRPRGATRI